MALIRIHGLYPTLDLTLQCERLGVYEQTTMVLAPLSSWSSTEPAQQLIRTFTKPGPVRLTE